MAENLQREQEACSLIDLQELFGDALNRESQTLDVASKLQAKSCLKTRALHLLSRREKHSAEGFKLQLAGLRSAKAKVSREHTLKLASTECKKHQAVRDANHWRWRAAILHLKLSGIEEVLELQRENSATLAAECASLQQQLDDRTYELRRREDLIVECAKRSASAQSSLQAQLEEAHAACQADAKLRQQADAELSAARLAAQAAADKAAAARAEAQAQAEQILAKTTADAAAVTEQLREQEQAAVAATARVEQELRHQLKEAHIAQGREEASRKGCEEKLAELELRLQQQLRAAQEELQAMRAKAPSASDLQQATAAEQRLRQDLQEARQALSAEQRSRRALEGKAEQANQAMSAQLAALNSELQNLRQSQASQGTAIKPHVAQAASQPAAAPQTAQPAPHKQVAAPEPAAAADSEADASVPPPKAPGDVDGDLADRAVQPEDVQAPSPPQTRAKPSRKAGAKAAAHDHPKTSTKRLTRQQMRAEEEAVNVATQASSNDVPDQQVPSEPEIEGIDEERAAADEQGEQENMHANNGQQPGKATKAVKGGRAKGKPQARQGKAAKAKYDAPQTDDAQPSDEMLTDAQPVIEEQLLPWAAEGRDDADAHATEPEAGGNGKRKSVAARQSSARKPTRPRGVSKLALTSVWGVDHTPLAGSEDSAAAGQEPIAAVVAASISQSQPLQMINNRATEAAAQRAQATNNKKLPPPANPAVGMRRSQAFDARAQGGKKRKLAPAHGNGFDTVPTSMLLKGAAGAGFQVPQLRKLASAN